MEEDDFILHEEAQELEDTLTPYSLARQNIELRKQLEWLEKEYDLLVEACEFQGINDY